MAKFRRTLGATTLIHDKVVNLAGQDIGRIEELMIDVTTGRVAYAVMSFGGFMGIGNNQEGMAPAAASMHVTPSIGNGPSAMRLQYDFGWSRTFSAMKLRISSRLTGAMR